MRLELPIPEGWQRRPAPGRDLYLVGAAPHVTVEVAPIVPAADLPPDLLGRGLPANAKLDGVRAVNVTTTSGWPLVVHQANVVDASGHVVESRLFAELTFSIFAAAVIVRAPDEVRLSLHSGEILATIERVRPRLRGRAPAAVAELWSMEEP